MSPNPFYFRHILSEAFEVGLTDRQGLSFIFHVSSQPNEPLHRFGEGRNGAVPRIKAQVTPKTSREFLAVTLGAAITSWAANTLSAVTRAHVLVTDVLLGIFPVVVTC